VVQLQGKAPGRVRDQGPPWHPLSSPVHYNHLPLHFHSVEDGMRCPDASPSFQPSTTQSIPTSRDPVTAYTWARYCLGFIGFPFAECFMPHLLGPARIGQCSQELWSLVSSSLLHILLYSVCTVSTRWTSPNNDLQLFGSTPYSPSKVLYVTGTVRCSNNNAPWLRIRSNTAFHSIPLSR
jgi:hypothetical protein